MGTTIRVWQVDRRRAGEFPDDMPETRRSMIADGTRELDLDHSWEDLASLLELLGLDNPFEADEMSAREVKRFARVLSPLTWPKLVDLCATLGAPIDDPEYVGPYYDEFRDMLLDAARANRSIAIDAL
jgi:hypothetical protein